MFLRLLLFVFLLTMIVYPQAPTIETGVSQTLARWRAANYSDVRYNLSITLEKQSPLMKGYLEIRVNLTEEGAKNDLVLDWRTTQFANDKDKPYARVVAVNEKNVAPVNGVDSVNYYVYNEHLGVSRFLLKPGENVVRIKFASPIKTSGAAVTRYIDKEDGAEYVYSLFVPSDASTAFPVFDQPDLKARFALWLTVPYDWQAVSNGRLIERAEVAPIAANGEPVPPSTVQYVFDGTQPISTYVFSFAAGRFVEFEDKPENPNGYAERTKFRYKGEKNTSSIYVRKSQAEKFKPHAAETFRLNREAVKYLENYFDFKFPFPKYDLVLIPEFPFNGMEHAGATFLRESSVIFPSEPTKNDLVSRANVIFHEAAHQWFGDTVTMKWFDDLWLKEGFAEFMAYKTLEKVLPEYNAWKAFYERNKPLAYLTDSTRGTTPIYQEIPNLSSAKSAYGNIVYRKAPSFLKQAEFFWGEDKFRRAVRAFLKNHQFANAAWQDLVKEIEEVEIAEIKKSEYYLKLSDKDKAEFESFKRWSVQKEWAEFWVEKRGTAIYRISPRLLDSTWDLQWNLKTGATGGHTILYDSLTQHAIKQDENFNWLQNVKVLRVYNDGTREEAVAFIGARKYARLPDEESKLIEALQRGERQEFKFPQPTEEESRKYEEERKAREARKTLYVFPNYQDYGYGIFLLDEQSREYILKNIQNEKDEFLRSMMWGSLWDSVREAELAPKDYVELAIKNISVETDELTIQTILNRVSTAMNYYLSDKQREELAPKVEVVLFGGMRNAKTLGQKITFFRAYLNVASSSDAQEMLKKILKSGGKPIELKVFGDYVGNIPSLEPPPLKTKDKFDIVARLLILENKRILGNNEAEKLLAELEKTETSDDARRYAYAARAAVATAENKAKFWNDFTTNREISESWIEAAFLPFNAVRHSELTLPYLEKALAELPNLKRSRKIFFVNGWLGAFIGGQKDEKALAAINKFLADNPNLDRDLRLKILENSDALERAVKIRAKYGN